jgi:PTS system ascorbate-specific IIA component
MIGILILGQKHFGRGLLEAVDHTFGKRPPRLVAVEVDYRDPPEKIGEAIREAVHALDQDQGVLILADVFGATHTNLACRVLARGHIELIGGVNLPMLLRALNYRELPMDELMDKALSGGCGGIVCASVSDAKRETRA